jgi:L-alanine-DL-glutamate epimerase-like enolase superfamily enzyme
VLIKAKTENGFQGMGEGCPRSYVTGETIETCHDFFNAHYSDFMNIGELNELKSWIKNHKEYIDKNPAAFCAVELALLDALSQEAGQSVEGLQSLPELSGEFQYTGVLGVSKPEVFQTMLQQYLHLGFTDFKVKVSGNVETDRANISALENCGQDNIRVRLDANNLWSAPDEVISYIKRLDGSIFALEEPLSAYEYEGCRKIFEELGTQIILDESFINESNFEHIQDSPLPWIINIRISKMGGILRSLAIAKRAKELGIPIIIGAQVGETSLLTRAALTVANTYRDILLAQEGAYGTHLLTRDIIDPPLMFGQGGVIAAM